MKLRYTERAIADLEAIQAHVARHNPRAAAMLGKRICTALDLLADFPGLGESATMKCARSLSSLTLTSCTIVWMSVLAR